MIVLVTGSRKLDRPLHHQWVSTTLDELHKQFDITMVMNGGADGPDVFSTWWAAKNSVPFRVYRPVWNSNGMRYNPQAAFDRNAFMVERLYRHFENGWNVRLVAFWDGKSRGTRHTIDYAKRYDMPMEVLQ